MMRKFHKDSRRLQRRTAISYHDLDEFTRAYIGAALWSSTCDEEDDCENLDDKYGPEDIALECINVMVEDCRRFQEQYDDYLAAAAYGSSEWSDDEMAGHDFWLTRNGHGAGFWDRDLGEVGDLLTEAADVFGETDLYVGDDGQIYCH